MRAMGFSALLIALPLAGCFEATSRPPGLGEVFMSKEQLAAKDDAICQGYGAKPGSDVYIQCRVTQDQRRDAVRNAPDDPIIAVPASDAPRLQNTIPPTVRCQTVGMQTVCR